MPIQIRRVSLLAVVIVALFLAARSQLVPESFGVYGHYRADSVEENAAFPAQYAGEEACLECHAGIDEAKIRSGHISVRCEACHGPLREHAATPAENKAAPLENVTEMCLLCHESNPTRPPEFSQIDPREHRPGIECLGCHDPHIPEKNVP